MLEWRECLRMQVIKQDPWKNCMHSIYVHVNQVYWSYLPLDSFSPPFHYFRSLPWLGRLESQKCQEECQRSHGQCREMAGYSSGKGPSGKPRERALCIRGPAGIVPAVRLEKQGSGHWKDQDVKNREKEGKDSLLCSSDAIGVVSMKCKTTWLSIEITCRNFIISN